MTRRKVIGVMGSGSDEHAGLALPLGDWIARSGYDLLTGGGPGVMAAVSRAFCAVPERRGIAIGVLPASRPASDYPNPWVELAIFTHLSGAAGPASAESRNHINVLSSDVVVALPGSEGTLAEIRLALHYRKPIVAYWPAALPGELPHEAPVARELADVQRFVLERT